MMLINAQQELARKDAEIADLKAQVECLKTQCHAYSDELRLMRSPENQEAMAKFYEWDKRRLEELKNGNDER